jgi:hypothetical protein
MRGNMASLQIIFSSSVRFASLVGILVSVFGQVEASVINARSVSFTDVSTAVGLAKDGDTVKVPAGTAAWSSTLIIAKGITLQGATTLTGPSSNPTVTDGTIIQDNVARTGANYGGVIVLFRNLLSTQSARLTGFTFKGGTVTKLNYNGVVQFAGRCPKVRVDHCYFNRLYNGPAAAFNGWLYGVFDHNKIDVQYTGPATRTSHSAWNNSVSGWGSWADYPYFGTEKFIFIEDNLITNYSKVASYGGAGDGAEGGRFVIRHNTFINGNIFYHGSDTGAGQGYKRGTRAVEIYNNTFKATFPAVATGQNRGGSLLWHDNIYTGTYSGGMTLKIYRMVEYEGNLPLWAGADGLSLWDRNATTEDGSTGVAGQVGYCCYTGTHVGANGSSATVVVSGTPWRSNQWIGYSVTNMNPNSPYFHGHNYIKGNTSNTLTLGTAVAAVGPAAKFNAGDAIAIRKVLVVLDQPGRGKGDLLTNYPNPKPSWPNQALEPCYSWNNTLNGANLGFIHNDNTVDILKTNVDFFNLGVGIGSAPSAVSSKYGAALNGVPYTGPYTYPHPLTSGLEPPTNLTISNP